MNTRKNAMAQSILLACALTVTACTGGASPPLPPESASPSVEQSPSPTPSPSPTKPKYQPATAKGPAKNVPKPEMPKLAKEHNEEGAIAFVKYYFDLVNYSLESRTVDDIIKVTERSCQVCGDNLIDPIRINGKQKYWQVAGKYSVKVNAVDNSERNTSDLLFTLTVEKTEIYSAPNELEAHGAAVTEPVSGIAYLSWDKDWKMSDMKFSG